ncbi:hypothetical protein GYMLUDRAFT_244043 [Collybiopsis luxurians FD-317 M1]|uniref:Uncharacterized protein n=1 Tax=Collybiopsis luxurians FD-317 M1 TaxID=944289 RepID=A0A0D0BAY1_9AGAR|nr:hypothetical protein GYMLUDRAFT_244043 [Collybiopsis luxurians FD-317 M1]
MLKLPNLRQAVLARNQELSKRFRGPSISGVWARRGKSKTVSSPIFPPLVLSESFPSFPSLRSTPFPVPPSSIPPPLPPSLPPPYANYSNTRSSV